MVEHSTPLHPAEGQAPAAEAVQTGQVEGMRRTGGLEKHCSTTRQSLAHLQKKTNITFIMLYDIPFYQRLLKGRHLCLSAATQILRINTNITAILSSI